MFLFLIVLLLNALFSVCQMVLLFYALFSVSFLMGCVLLWLVLLMVMLFSVSQAIVPDGSVVLYVALCFILCVTPDASVGLYIVPDDSVNLCVY